MATNLRLRPELDAALKRESERTQRSQQEIIRTAVEQYLRLLSVEEPSLEETRSAARRQLRPPRTPYRQATAMLVLPEGMGSLDLMQREDRF